MSFTIPFLTFVILQTVLASIITTNDFIYYLLYFKFLMSCRLFLNRAFYCVWLWTHVEPLEHNSLEMLSIYKCINRYTHILLFYWHLSILKMFPAFSPSLVHVLSRYINPSTCFTSTRACSRMNAGIKHSLVMFIFSSTNFCKKLSGKTVHTWKLQADSAACVSKGNVHLRNLN